MSHLEPHLLCKLLAHCQVIPCIIKGLSISPDNVELWNRGDSLHLEEASQTVPCAVPVKPGWGLTDVFAQVYFLQDWGWWGWCVHMCSREAIVRKKNIEHVEIDMLKMVKTRILISPMNSLPRFDAYWRIVSRFWLSCPHGRGICEWRSNPWVAGWHGLLDEINLPKIWTGWWFCNLFRIKIWSYCHYLHGLKPPRKTIHHSAVSRWFALHQIWAWVEHGVPMDKNTICHVNYDKLSILWDWILTHTDLNHSMSFYIHHTDHKSDNSENIYKILKNLKNLLKSLPMHILHIPSQSSWCLAGCQLHATLALSLQQLGIFERYRVAVCQAISHEIGPVPIGSMYAIYGNIYHQYTPNVSIYTIHGSYGV